MADDIGSFSDLLRKSLGDTLDTKADSFMEMVADDVVMEFPYAPPGMVTRLDGKAALTQHLKNLGGMLAFDRMSEPVVNPSIDPDVFVLEFTGHGKGVETGEPYDQQYISVIRLRHGKIVHYRDYWNPLVALRALRGSTVVAALIGGGADRG